MLNGLKGVFACLNSHDVRYLVIGGVAAIAHGVNRLTYDLDMLIDATPGIQFDAAWARRETAVFRDQTFFLLGKEDLVASKRAAGRDVDLKGVRLLQLDDEAATNGGR